MWKRYHVEIDKDELLGDLDLAKKDMNKIARQMMAKVSQAIRKDVKEKNLKGGVLQKQEGLLLKSLSYKAKNDFTATISANSPYASVHEQGATILPKNGKYLAFQIDGKWIRTEKVTIPQRMFLLPVIEDYFSSSKAEKVMDDVLQKALDEIFERDNK
jgi:phage gpG-like protein